VLGVALVEQRRHDHLTATELKPGFVFGGERIPLVNPQRGIFKPQQMKFLLSIKTVFPKPGGKFWYDDQREVHRQIYEGDETIDYAFMGQDPDAADNRWLREAYENKIPVIYFLGVVPGRYQAMLPTFIIGWDGKALKARVAFGMPNQETLAPPESALERRETFRPGRRPADPGCAGHKPRFQSELAAIRCGPGA
jgi:putative restriction endonuclease